MTEAKVGRNWRVNGIKGRLKVVEKMIFNEWTAEWAYTTAPPSLKQRPPGVL